MTASLGLRPAAHSVASTLETFFFLGAVASLLILSGVFVASGAHVDCMYVLRIVQQVLAAVRLYLYNSLQSFAQCYRTNQLFTPRYKFLCIYDTR